MKDTYKLKKGSTQHKFWQSRAKIQMMAGGYGNGKSSAACVKAITLASDYPGSRGLLARATYQQLQDTTMKTFFEWLPEDDIKRMPVKDDSTLLLKNGSAVKFGYIRQTGKGLGESTSNVLSAEYDWIVIDQVEDPLITYKDFTDMLGRLRRQTPYRGTDVTMPSTGPRWLILACNPTRNWVYHKVVRPWELWTQKQIQSPDLLVDPDTGELLVEIFNGDTSENSDNLPRDYIRTMIASHKGAMGKRFIEGKWAAYEGLVYPDFDINVHVIGHQQVVSHYKRAREFYALPILQGFDHGLSAPSCYLIAYIDDKRNLILMDGVYETGLTPRAFAKRVTELRNIYNIEHDSYIKADPAIFRRTSGGADKIGIRVSNIYEDVGLRMERATRDKESGIVTLNTYMHVDTAHQNPFTGGWGAPRFYVSDKCTWFIDECSDYYWKKSTAGLERDETQDGRDHALDGARYMMTGIEPIAGAIVRKNVKIKPWMQWQEMEVSGRDTRMSRYGR